MDMVKSIHWQWLPFAALGVDDLYAILALRQEVFVVEQRCAYLDCDGRDQEALHLIGWSIHGRTRRPLAYLRVLPPGGDGLPVRIGRLLTHTDIRQRGVAGDMLRLAIERLEKSFPGRPIAISAQQYLLAFYERFGFCATSPPYLEDGIPHVDMIRSP